MREGRFSPRVLEAEPIPEKTEIVDAETLKHSLKKIKTANDLVSFREDTEITAESGHDLASILDRRQWGNIFTQLQPGDKVLTFLTPGASFLAIKYLNDEIFGEEITNSIIIKRRNLVKSAVEELNSGRPDEEKISSLESDYKIEVMRIPKNTSIDPAQIDAILNEIDVVMKGFILGLIPQVDMAHGNQAKADNFRQSMEGGSGENNSKGGFKMNYGLATVEDSEDTTEKAEEKVLAVARSLQAGRMARAEAGYGLEFNKDSILKDLEGIKNLRNEIVEGGNTITDTDGNVFTIFHEESNVGGRVVFRMDRDLLRAVRKNEFTVSPDQPNGSDLMKQIILYTKKLNLLDTIKPFLISEIGAVAKQAEQSRDLGKRISNLSPDEKEGVAKTLFSDERAGQFTSKMEFDRRAVGMPDAVYISMDVLDLGVDLLLEYEASLQEIDKAHNPDEKMKLFKFRSLSAGDKTTKKLRTFWANVEAVCSGQEKDEENGKGFKLKGLEGLITAHVGGDELVLAVELGEGEGKLPPDKVKDLLFALQAINDTRVIETRVSESVKHVDQSSIDNDGEKTKAHLQAIKRAGNGAKILKKVEDDARRLTFLFKKTENQEDLMRAVQDLHGVFLVEKDKKGKILVRPNIVIVEKHHIFEIFTKDEDKGLKYRDLKISLDAIFKKK